MGTTIAAQNGTGQAGDADPRAHDWGLYRTGYEKDSCGFGLIANLDDQPSHWLLQTAMSSLNRLTHRGAIAADGKTGDGCGLLIKMPVGFLRAAAAEAGFSLTTLFGPDSCSWTAIRSRPIPRAARSRSSSSARSSR